MNGRNALLVFVAFASGLLVVSAHHLRFSTSFEDGQLLAWADASAGELMTARTDNLVIQWQEGDATDEEVEVARKRGEAFFAAIAELLGHAPDHSVYISLEGPAERPDGSWGYPRVDGWGRILLYRFAPTADSYFNALAHEMVHVFRLQRRPHHDWFLEEGFAEFVARRVDDSLRGFPWYGFSPALVAGQFVLRGEDIPLTALQARHRELNLPCKLQSYALRGAFFDWLGRTFGDDAVIAFAQKEEAGDLASYSEAFGSDLSALAEMWRKSVLVELQQMEGADASAHAYRSESPAQYGRICLPDRDF